VVLQAPVKDVEPLLAADPFCPAESLQLAEDSGQPFELGALQLKVTVCPDVEPEGEGTVGSSSGVMVFDLLLGLLQ